MILLPGDLSDEVIYFCDHYMRDRYVVIQELTESNFDMCLEFCELDVFGKYTILHLQHS